MTAYQQKPTAAAVHTVHTRNAGGNTPIDQTAAQLQARMTKLDGLIARYESTLAEGIGRALIQSTQPSPPSRALCCLGV